MNIINLHNSFINGIDWSHLQNDFVLVHIVTLTQLFGTHHHHHNRQNRPSGEGLTLYANKKEDNRN